MSLRAEVLLWAQRVVARKSPTAHQILELPDGAQADAVQEAFHRIARMAHPDLHRNALTAEELELVTTAYARAAAAYQELRGPRPSTTRLRPIRDLDAPPGPPGKGNEAPRRKGNEAPRREGNEAPRRNDHVARTELIPTSPQSNKAIAVPPGTTSPPGSAAPAMTPRAFLYYRKAELCLLRGELAEAMLQIKMAIASDPQSQLLRSALAEVEAEVRKKP